MSAQWNAMRLGARRGWLEWIMSLRNLGDVSYTIVGVIIAGVVVYLYRDATLIDGSTTPMAVYVVASVLAVQLTFATTYNVAVLLSTEREDGTLLRMKSLPSGVRAYTTGITTRAILDFVAVVAVTLVVVVVILWPRMTLSALDVLILAGVLVLGIIALTSFGFVLGSIFRSPRAVGGWGILLIGALAWVSGLVQPMVSMPTWAQVIGQGSPLYWVGLGIRAALLPGEFSVLEVGGEWRLWLVFPVLAAWTAAGLLLAPMLLSRMARRESATSVAQGRERALSRV
ncbi:ABC transporter permease [Salinibacterium sp. dk2585]|uniref:ABC transporter permease n=1 Tax=unclassified Salinibacterium TaxID=2632331 RepID=UPI0011C25713|nr:MULTISPECIES: ABC transporter permease [unclassified Salinibacterium]QEE62278.1 ABC transporter permease [Salinibacterium sp. dk2585]TXK53630.1 ABC transporter permease [Salinibacterium sp. dk5596]